MSNEPLTVDEAMAEFSRLIEELPETAPRAGPPEHQTPEQADAANFRFAEGILSLLCPDPMACRNSAVAASGNVAYSLRGVRCSQRIQNGHPAPRRCATRSGPL